MQQNNIGMTSVIDQRMAVVPPQKYTSAENKSNNGEHNYHSCKTSSHLIRHDKLFTDDVHVSDIIQNKTETEIDHGGHTQICSIDEKNTGNQANSHMFDNSCNAIIDTESSESLSCSSEEARDPVSLTDATGDRDEDEDKCNGDDDIEIVIYIKNITNELKVDVVSASGTEFNQKYDDSVVLATSYLNSSANPTYNKEKEYVEETLPKAATDKVAFEREARQETHFSFHAEVEVQDNVETQTDSFKIATDTASMVNEELEPTKTISTSMSYTDGECEAIETQDDAIIVAVTETSTIENMFNNKSPQRYHPTNVCDNNNDSRTPKRVHFQAPSRGRTPRTVSRAHKIEPENSNNYRPYGRCSQSRSSESMVANNTTSSRTNAPTTHRNTGSVSHIYNGQKGNTTRSNDTDKDIKNRPNSRDNWNNDSTPDRRKNYSNRGYHSSKTNDSCPKQTNSSSSQHVASTHLAEKRFVILRKGQDIASAVAEQEKLQMEKNIQREREDIENKSTITILKPERNVISATELKQMTSSVQISKSQNSIKQISSSSNLIKEANENYRSKSTVTANNGGLDADREKDSKHKLKQMRRKKKQNKPKKVPKTQLELFQRLIETGHLRSKFSRYKTEGLREIKLIEELHKGTFAVKYKASYQNKQVVLSVYYDQDVSDIDDVEMARMGNCYFVLGINDCIAGPNASLWFLSINHNLGDLQKMLSRDNERHVIGERHAQFITAGVLYGVDFLHNRDIVHGNIKPSKVLINNLGFPVLTGFLKTMDCPESEHRDVYTPAYAAPERYRGYRGTAVDIFSIGCLAYEIVTGSTPFDGGSLEETKANILKVDVRPLYEPELFSLAGEFFLDSCLCKNAKERFEIGDDKKNMFYEEWFSTLDWREYKRQTLKSPILEAMQLIDNSATLDWEEKGVQYNWGRIMDIACPDAPTFDDEGVIER